MATNIAFTCPHCKAQLRGSAEVQGKKVRCKGCGNAFVAHAGAQAAAKADGRPVPAQGNKPQPKAPARPAASKTAASPKAAKPAPPPKTPPKPSPDDEGPATYGLAGDDAPLPSAAANKDKAAPKAAPKPVFEDGDSNPYGITELDLTPRCPHCAKEMEAEDAVICLHCGYNTRTRTSAYVTRTIANTGSETFLWLLPGIAFVILDLCLMGLIAYLWLGLSVQPDPVSGESDSGGWVFPLQVWGSIVSAGVIWGTGMFAFKRLVLHPTPPEFEKK